MKAQIKFYRPVYVSSGESDETEHLRSIARASANYIEKKGYR